MSKLTRSIFPVLVIGITLAMLLFICTASAYAASDYAVHDGKVMHKGKVLPAVTVDTLEQGTLRYKAFINAKEAGVPEKEQGVYFFDPQGKNIGFLPLASEEQSYAMLPSPNGRHILSIGDDNTLTLYTLPNEKPTAQFTSIAYEPCWIGPDTFFMLRRDAALDIGDDVPLLLTSVLLYDTKTSKTTVLKQSDATHSYGAESVGERDDVIRISEQAVKHKKDWKNEKKIRITEFEIKTR